MGLVGFQLVCLFFKAGNAERCSTFGVIDSGEDVERTICDWTGTNQLGTFSGGSLTLKDVTCTDCKASTLTGSIVYASDFLGDLYFEKVIVSDVVGGSGCIFFSNTNPGKKVELNNCKFNRGHFATYGCLNGVGSSGQRLSVSVSECTFENVYAVTSGGAVRGSQPEWTFQDCTFENCSCDTEAGAFLFIAPSAGNSAISNLLTIRRCGFDNKALNVGKQQVMVSFRGESSSSPHVSFQACTIYWEYRGQKNLWALEVRTTMSFDMKDSILSHDSNRWRFAAIVTIETENGGVGLFQNNTFATIWGESLITNGLQLSRGTFVFIDCTFKNLRLGIWGETFNGFTCQTWKLACFGCRFLELGYGYWGNMGGNAFLHVDSQFIEKVRTRFDQNNWPFWEGAGTLTIECCCFQSHRGARIGIKFSGNIVLGSGNCFSMASATTAVTGGTQSGDPPNYNCKTCNAECEESPTCLAQISEFNFFTKKGGYIRYIPYIPLNPPQVLAVV
jgi:hypothetical protein